MKDKLYVIIAKKQYVLNTKSLSPKTLDKIKLYKAEITLLKKDLHMMQRKLLEVILWDKRKNDPVHRKHRKAKLAEHYLNNKPIYKARAKAWQQNNRERVNALNRLKRAKKKLFPKPVPQYSRLSRVSNSNAQAQYPSTRDNIRVKHEKN